MKGKRGPSKWILYRDDAVKCGHVVVDWDSTEDWPIAYTGDRSVGSISTSTSPNKWWPQDSSGNFVEGVFEVNLNHMFGRPMMMRFYAVRRGYLSAFKAFLAGGDYQQAEQHSIAHIRSNLQRSHPDKGGDPEEFAVWAQRLKARKGR